MALAELERAIHPPGVRSKGVAVLLGEACGPPVYALDFDEMDAYSEWAIRNPVPAALCPTSESNRGTHVFFCPPDGAPALANRRFSVTEGGALVGELIGTRKLAVLPPTRHPAGVTRRWRQRGWLARDKPTGRMTFDEMGVFTDGSPEAMMQAAMLAGHDPITSVGEGGRHSALISIAGRLARQGLDGEAIRAALASLNSRYFKPPLQETASPTSCGPSTLLPSLRVTL